MRSIAHVSIRFSLLGLLVAVQPLSAADSYEPIRQLLSKYCVSCHSTAKQKGELDLEQFTSMADVKKQPHLWEKLLEQLADNEMPPKASQQPTPEQRKHLIEWVRATLNEIGLEKAGDPGPVGFRRLSNMEFTYTIRDLTGVPTLDPAREFPADGAAGEGFTNAAAALVMSPSLLTKYLDAAKEISGHVVFLPDGFRFSPATSQRDWTNESLASIRQFYHQFSEPIADKVTVDGAGAVRSDGGRIPLRKYLSAITEQQEAIVSGQISLRAIAQAHGLSPKYLHLLWSMLHDTRPSAILDGLRSQWRARTLSAADIEAWQQSLWRFTNVGHLGKLGGPKAWQEPVTPLAPQHEFRLKLRAPTNGTDIVFYLAADDAGDGHTHDFVVWEQPRLVAPGRPDLLLRDVRAKVQQMNRRRQLIAATAYQCLAAADEIQRSNGRVNIPELARKVHVDESLLRGWLTYLGIHSSNGAHLGTIVTRKLQGVANYRFLNGWGGDDALSFLANSSDATVQIPGTMKPKSFATHPSPRLASIIAWRSPVAGNISLHGSIQDAHTACGNGIRWSVEIRRGTTREVLAAGHTSGDRLCSFGPFNNIAVQKADAVAVVIRPGNADHSCDLTAVTLTIEHGSHRWDLVEDVVPNVLLSNPLPDRFGHPSVWHFGTEPEQPSDTWVLPQESLLAKWRSTSDIAERQHLAMKIQHLLQQDPGTLAADSPDRVLHTQLHAWNGPLLASARTEAVSAVDDGSPTPYGIDPIRFGRHPHKGNVDAASLCVQAPSVIEVRLPASLVEGAEFVVNGKLHPDSPDDASAQLHVATSAPRLVGLQPCPFNAAVLSGAWNSGRPSMAFTAPIIVANHGSARRRFERAFADFRYLFPAALCYTTIVPVDEVVTLTLYHREDEPLMRLMLDEKQQATLNRLWDELHFISHDAIALVDAYEQIWQYSTQDGPDAPHGDKRLEPLREPILQGAAAFRQRLVEAEPVQLNAAIAFAARAWRRPLTDHEKNELSSLYKRLRRKELSHDAALRTVLTRIFVAPAFLYRGEEAPPGVNPARINDWELATRLSYFLWSSCPDEVLRHAAAEGRLQNPEVLSAHALRMMKDARIRRLAVEFGCQWLHVRDLETLDEKSERHFPEFRRLRAAMQEETTLFFKDLFQHDRSVLSLLDADHSFVNGALANHYGVTIPSADWHRIDGMRAAGRGGMLAFASVLCKQSGASRTSPILRGNWLSEVVLGEKLPRPPKDVPTLPEEAPRGLTERQLIERHSSDERCSKCHRKIDPFGFALEGFDAIGRRRVKDTSGLPIDTRTTLASGHKVDGLDGLKHHLLTVRRDDFLRQFCRKLLGYALGRGVQLSDKPLLDAMLARLHSNEYRISVAVDAIITSRQFREVRGRDFEGAPE